MVAVRIGILIVSVATFEAHCIETERAFGKPYTEVHQWLDEFFPDNTLGARHRRIRHHG
jgi:hypothetical protein